MIASVSATQNALVEAEEMDKLRLARAVQKYRPLAQELVNSAIDTAVSAGRKIGAYVFEVMRLIGVPSETVGTFNAAEYDWREKHPGDDGQPAGKLPDEARSYIATKSAMLKQWSGAPFYANIAREYAGIVSVRTGQPLADLLVDGFLEIESDRYGGKPEKAVAQWREDFRAAKEAEKRVEENKKAGLARVLAQSATGSAATPQGMTNAGVGGQFQKPIQEALNRLIKAVGAAEGVIEIGSIIAIIGKAETALLESVAAKRDLEKIADAATARLKADKAAGLTVESAKESEDAATVAALKDVLPDDEALDDEAAKKLDEDLAAQTAQG